MLTKYHDVNVQLLECLISVTGFFIPHFSLVSIKV